MRLVALDAEAERFGLGVGQSLSDARAMCPALVAREIDEGFTQSTFANFADWHSNTSPIVSVVEDWGPYGDLVLDITGVAHLFAGEEALLTKVSTRLQGLGFSVQGAIASSVGAAMALSHFAPGQIVGGEGAGARGSTLTHPAGTLSHQGRGEEIAETLAELSVAALRIDDVQIAGLAEMGLKRIGQLYGRDRGALQARFGLSLLTRLDQALGLLEERVIPRLPVPERMVERKFAEPIGLIDDVVMTANDLAHGLSGRLEAEGLGAQTFHLMLYRVDHKLLVLSVNAARATRDAGHIGRLFANRIEKLTGDFDAGFGIDVIRLAATSVSALNDMQGSVFGSVDGAADLDFLCDRLASRLGVETILRTKPLNSHMPERAVTLEPVMARTDDDVEAQLDPDLVRPLRLLPTPEEIQVVAEVPDGPPVRMKWRRLDYHFAKASGPERIGVEWWRPDEGALTRDYYIGEDETGRRFWLFREGLYGTETATPRWFLHGLFA